jgi:hypothetical protein
MEPRTLNGNSIGIPGFDFLLKLDELGPLDLDGTCTAPPDLPAQFQSTDP